MQTLSNQLLIVIFTAQDVSLKSDLLYLLPHEILTHLALLLDQCQLLLQILPLLLESTFMVLIISELLRQSFFLSLDLFQFLLAATDDFLTFAESLLGLVLELFFKFVVLFQDFLFYLRFCEL